MYRGFLTLAPSERGSSKFRYRCPNDACRKAFLKCMEQLS